jgi:hypothetical protein
VHQVNGGVILARRLGQLNWRRFAAALAGAYHQTKGHSMFVSACIEHGSFEPSPFNSQRILSFGPPVAE